MPFKQRNNMKRTKQMIIDKSTIAMELWKYNYDYKQTSRNESNFGIK